VGGVLVGGAGLLLLECVDFVEVSVSVVLEVRGVDTVRVRVRVVVSVSFFEAFCLRMSSSQCHLAAVAAAAEAMEICLSC